MIVPFPPGGPVDVIARIVTQGLPQILGQTVVIENRGGASGTIGAQSSSQRVRADGYTLLFGNISSLVVHAGRHQQPRLRSGQDLHRRSPRSRRTIEVLVVHPDFPAKSVRELVAYAKANPGKLNFGSAGIGNATHLAAELFKQRTGIDIVHVPYKGAFEAVTGVIGRTGADVLRRHRRRAAADPRGPRARAGAFRARRAAPTCRPADHDRKRRARTMWC